jgi:hypothetical protein
MAFTGKMLADGFTAPALTNTVIYTGPGSGLQHRISEIWLYNFHTADVDVFLGWIGNNRFFETMKPKQWMPIGVNTIIPSTGTIFINPSIANVIIWYVSGYEDING